MNERELAAFEAAYRECYPSLVEYCRRCMNGRGDPEAIAQEAFLRAWTTPDRYHGTRLRSWVSIVARHLCIDVGRRALLERSNLRATLRMSDVSIMPVDERLEIDEEHRQALLALERVPSRYRRLIELRYLNGWSYEEIARAEQTSVEAVRSGLRRARSALRKAYTKVAPAEGLVVVRWYRSVRRRVAAQVDRVDRTLATWMQVQGIGNVAIGLVAVATSNAPNFLLTAPTPSTGPVVVANARDAVAPGHAPGPRPLHSVQVGIDLPSPPPRREVVQTPLADVALTLLPSDEDETDMASFVSYTHSPRYAEDGTVFAVGVRHACINPTCQTVFRSIDRGATWTRLRSAGFVGRKVLLPITYPDDPRIFGAGVSLQVSLDGGASFLSLGTGGDAAISPEFTTDGRILLGTGFEYVDRLGTIVPSDTTRPLADYQPAFSPAYATDRVTFAAVPTHSADRNFVAVARCVGSMCGTPVQLTGTNHRTLAVSPRFAVDGRVALGDGNLVHVSSDGGFSYRTAQVPVEGSVRSVTFDDRGRLFVALRELTSDASYRGRGGLVVSEDAGRSWRVIGAQTLPERNLATVHVLPDGRILVGAEWESGGGLWCSADDGETWQVGCPAA